MNILHISVRADFGGGPEHLYRQVIGQVENHSLNVFIACPDDYPYFERYSDVISESKVLVIPHRKFNIFRLFKLIKFVCVNKIDIIHSHGKGAGLYGRLLSLFSNIPSVHTFHGLHVGEYSNVKKRIYIGIEKVLGLSTERVICVSDSEFESLKSERIVPAKKLIQINNGVKVPDSIPSRVIGSPLNILSVNRFDTQKNPELLIAIAEAIKTSPLYNKVKISVIGVGDKFNNCQQSINDKGLNDVISLLGPSTSPRTNMAEADAFLSTSRWEGMPLAVLEAMSEGLPIIATRVAGNMDVMEDNVEGVFFNDDDATDALIGIEKILSDGFRLKCSDAARKSVVDNYSVSKMVNETVRVYKDIVSSVFRNK
jgi:glycosyltransferase involved in cell wall biosynthesis